MSSDSAATARLRAELAAVTGTNGEDWFFVFKARYGMQAVFDALRANRAGTEVLTQVLTCSTAIDPILAAGLTPRYGEVAEDTLALDPASAVVGSATAAVVVQHTFGIIADEATAALRERAHGAGALLVEDSAHCVARLARDAGGEPLADVSVHSFGVDKILRTRFGGAIWVNPELADRSLRDGLRASLGSLPGLSRRLDWVTRINRGQSAVLNRLPGKIGGPLRSGLARVGLFEYVVSPIEQRGRLPYAPMASSPWIDDQARAHLESLAPNEAQRRAAVAVYQRELAGHIDFPAILGGDAQPLVRFPIRVPQAEALISNLASQGYFAGRWYRPAIFPGPVDASAYGYAPGTLPRTERIIDEIVNLPTNVPPEAAASIAARVRDFLR
ncbi:DegT/DnrJ/EryC1/StrS family aminotransferase [Rarobacter faecitabidus]|uniref:dTDP-4-amino-4,6-dideoxygalactose transaminase n=1 Tax=Rarobacter faecitabidus TaxID=13243 RepID=A0A542ZW14_RARFA|nr:DegT/DnrJ/EryC1/StrS family aminotransferase [Rarobacter faecitabidus]TQL64554.1 dTDP-4-amino-4,6-dideoxygalactose transaminase [Rarobacter faecitabidus]